MGSGSCSSSLTMRFRYPDIYIIMYYTPKAVHQNDEMPRPPGVLVLTLSPLPKTGWIISYLNSLHVRFSRLFFSFLFFLCTIHDGSFISYIFYVFMNERMTLALNDLGIYVISDFLPCFEIFSIFISVRFLWSSSVAFLHVGILQLSNILTDIDEVINIFIG